MNIERLSGQPLSDVLRDTGPQGSGGKAGQSLAGSARDRIEFSDMARLMFKGAMEFRMSGEPRPDSIQQFKASLDQPVEWSDEVVGVILDRMLSD